MAIILNIVRIDSLSDLDASESNTIFVERTHEEDLDMYDEALLGYYAKVWEDLAWEERAFGSQYQRIVDDLFEKLIELEDRLRQNLGEMRFSSSGFVSWSTGFMHLSC